jgi:LysR family glycine cleavage system transcriptional activator
MSTRIPPFSALRAFEALARLERVTAVAKELNLTHGAISHQIKSLEDLVGVPLFHRQARAMTLTDAGRTYAYQVRQILDELGQVTSQLREPVNDQTLSLTVLPSFAMHWLLPRLKDFRDRHPDIHLQLHAGMHFMTFDKTRIDAALRFGHGQWPNVQTERLMGDSLVVVASPDLIGKTLFKNIQMLWKFPWLHAGESWAAWLTSAGIDEDPAATVMQFTDSTHLIEAARRGMGLALTRRSIAHELLQSGALKCLSSVEPVHQSSYYLVWPHRNQPHPSLRVFRDWMSIQVMKYQASLR